MVISDPRHTECSQKQDDHNIYVIMQTSCWYHWTKECSLTLWHLYYIYIMPLISLILYSLICHLYYAPCLACWALFSSLVPAMCFHDNIYIMLIFCEIWALRVSGITYDHLYMYVYMYICIYIHTYIYLYIYIYIYICRHVGSFGYVGSFGIFGQIAFWYTVYNKTQEAP